MTQVMPKEVSTRVFSSSNRILYHLLSVSEIRTIMRSIIL